MRGEACGWEVRSRWRRASERISCSSGEDSEMSVARRGAGMGRPVNGAPCRRSGCGDGRPAAESGSSILALPFRRLADWRCVGIHLSLSFASPSPTSISIGEILPLPSASMRAVCGMGGVDVLNPSIGKGGTEELRLNADSA